MVTMLSSGVGEEAVFLVVEQGVDGDGCDLPAWASADGALLLEEVSVLPLFRLDDGSKVVLREDLYATEDIFAMLAHAVPTDLFGRRPLSLLVGQETRIDLAVPDLVGNFGYYAGLRNLCRVVGRTASGSGEVVDLPYFGCSRVCTSNAAVIEEVKNQMARSVAVEASDAGQFAHSAYYMGSKRTLGPFVAEAVGSTLSGEGIVVDLMCGSGAASGAFSRLWRTFASDAQEFCRVLARVQGGGYERAAAEGCIGRILDSARENTESLREKVRDGMEKEEEFFHGDLNEDTLRRYQDFVARWPTYPGGAVSGRWDPCREVEERRVGGEVVPYCLFTAYYANIYFGLRQAVEIDGLRYGIERLRGKRDRQWAMGALVASLSALGSTFGGHFAQPAVRRVDRLSVRKAGALMEMRAASITHEFCARYLSLAGESERAPYVVDTVPGPWRSALESVEAVAGDGDDVTVYVDAPYSREEYSRYYHVLETLVRYRYPDSVGVGRVPSKRHGGRFHSEFFTRNRKALVDAFGDVITSILERGWVCAWSYSDRGDVCIPVVVEEVCRRVRSKVRSYAAPYRHKALGGSQAKAVVEHLVVFRRK